ncbi:MAG: hypothetical protein E6706_06175, partial [Anaerococcus hydrogenalis]|nr:hypothetical protein [Anaerococcus hydrogenalis]
MKKILIFLLIFIFSSCTNNDKDKIKSDSTSIKENKISSESISNENEKKKRLEYKHDNMEGFIRDDSLLVDRMLGDYPADELKNLDYDKNLSISAFNIRIPNRCMVYKKDDNYL